MPCLQTWKSIFKLSNYGRSKWQWIRRTVLVSHCENRSNTFYIFTENPLSQSRVYIIIHGATILIYVCILIRNSVTDGCRAFPFPFGKSCFGNVFKMAGEKYGKAVIAEKTSWNEFGFETNLFTPTTHTSSTYELHSHVRPVRTHTPRARAYITTHTTNVFRRA